MEIKQLMYFREVAKVGNISKAAEMMHVAQPALTLSIQKLERELSLVLFDRSRKPLALTNEGEIFLKRIESLIHQYDDILAEMRDLVNDQIGRIRIGVPPMLGAYLFPPIFSEFHQSYSGIQLSIIEEGSLEVKKKLISDELDIGVIMVEDEMPMLNLMPITTHEVKVCLPKNHPLAHVEVLSMDMLKNESFILLNEQTYMRQRVLTLCKEAGFEPHILFSSNQISTILRLVAQGSGIAFMLHSLAESTEDIVALSLDEPLFINASLAWSKNSYVSRATKTFIEFIDGFSSRLQDTLKK